jgi:hypothetical protein
MRKPALLFIWVYLFSHSHVYPQAYLLQESFYDYYKQHHSSNVQPLFFEDTIFTEVGRWAWGNCRSVFIQDFHAYIDNGISLQILDISEPAHPVLEGEIELVIVVSKIIVKDTLVFISGGDQIFILNTTDFNDIKIISVIQLSDIALTFAISEDFLYVTLGSEVIQFWDISDLELPLLRRSVNTARYAYSVEAKDKYVFIGALQSSIVSIINANNPDSLTYSYIPSGNATALSIKENLLCVGVYNSKLKFYDISNPFSPQFASEILINDSLYIDAVTVADNGLTAFVLCTSTNTIYFSAEQGVYSVDLSSLSTPSITDTLVHFTQSPGKAIDAEGNLAAAAYGTGLCILDITNPALVELESVYPTADMSSGLSISDSILFIASGYAGLWILDISNPESPKSISNIQTGGFAVDVIAENGIAYLLNSAPQSPDDTLGGLWIIDISNLFSPEVMSHYRGSMSHTNISLEFSFAKFENYIIAVHPHITNSDIILEIIDVKNPLSPQLIGSLGSSEFIPRNISIMGDYAFLGTSESGLKIIDISDVQNPKDMGSFGIAFRGILASGENAYVTTTDSLIILNISDPLHPYKTGGIKKPQYTFVNTDFYLRDSILYWGDLDLGAVNIKDKNSPKLLGTRFGYDWVNDVAVKDNLVIYSDKRAGVSLLKNIILSDVEELIPYIYTFTLEQNYPNPFNSSTVISFTIPNPDYLSIKYYNILGEEIGTLSERYYHSGKYSLVFNADDLPSGIYVYVIQSRTKIMAKKMIMIK